MHSQISLRDDFASRREALVSTAARAFAAAGLDGVSTERFAALFEALAGAIDEDYVRLMAAGAAQGDRSGTSARERGLNRELLNRIHAIRNELLFRELPAMLPFGLRGEAVTRIGAFIAGYMQGFSVNTELATYQRFASAVRSLTVARNVGEIEQAAVEAACDLVEVDGAWFARYDEGVFRVSFARGLPTEATSFSASDEEVDGFAQLVRGETVESDERSATEPLRRLSRILNVRAMLNIPILIDGRLRAVLAAGRRSTTPFSAQDRAILEMLAAQCGATLRERYAVEQLNAAHAAVAASEQQFRTLAEAISQLVWTANPDGWIDWYNHRWYSYTGQTHEEAEGWGWQAAHHPEDLPAVMEAWPAAIRSGEPFEMEFRLRGEDGVFRWFLTRVLPLRDETGRIVKWYGTNTDIDEQKRTLHRKEEIVNALQQFFIPKALPQISGLTFDAVYVPAENDALVGGDWYDAFVLPDRRIGFSIGDVSGHGLDAAATMGRIRQAIFTAALDTADPATILRKVNQGLLGPDGRIATAIVGFIDVQEQVICYASAGHPPLVLSHSAAQTLPYGGLPLGVEDESDWETQEARWQPGALLLLYTDGVTEYSRDPVSGERALLEATMAVARRRDIANPASAICRAIIGSATPRDDIAMLAIRLG